MYKNYAFVNGDNVLTNSYGAPYEQNILEKFVDNRIIEYGIISDDQTTQNETTVQSESTAQSTTDISNETTNTTTNNTDNSITANTNIDSTIAIDSSQETTNVNTTDNSSVMNIASSTDTYNVDNSSVSNNTTSNIQNKLINSCGMSISEAEQAINIVKDESINTNIDNSNTFVNTGDNVTISDVILESELDFVGPEVDRSCAIDAMNELDSQLSAENDNE